MNAPVDNVQRIVEAINQHNAECVHGPAVAIELHPLEIEQMGWEPGDTLAGAELRADPTRQTGTFKVVCAGEDEPDEAAAEEAEARRPLRVPMGPLPHQTRERVPA